MELRSRNAQAIAAEAAEDAQADLLPILMSLARSTRQLVSVKLREIGVEVGQDQLLFVLHLQRGVTVCEVARLIGVRPSTTSKMADRLVEKGWLVREHSTADARQTLMRLTPAGEETRLKVEATWLAIERELNTSLRVDDRRDHVLAALDGMADILSRRLMRLR